MEKEINMKKLEERLFADVDIVLDTNAPADGLKLYCFRINTSRSGAEPFSGVTMDWNWCFLSESFEFGQSMDEMKNSYLQDEQERLESYLERHSAEGTVDALIDEFLLGGLYELSEYWIPPEKLDETFFGDVYVDPELEKPHEGLKLYIFTRGDGEAGEREDPELYFASSLADAKRQYVELRLNMNDVIPDVSGDIVNLKWECKNDLSKINSFDVTPGHIHQLRYTF